MNPRLHPTYRALQAPIFDEPMSPEVESELRLAIKRHSIRIVGSDAAHGRDYQQVYNSFVKGYRVQFLVREHLKRAGFQCEKIPEKDFWVDERVNGENFEIKCFSVFNKQPSFRDPQMYQTLLANADKLDYFIAVRYFSKELLQKLELDFRPFVQPWFLINAKNFKLYFSPSNYPNSAGYYQTGLAEKAGNCVRILPTPDILLPESIKQRLAELKLKEEDLPDHEDVI